MGKINSISETLLADSLSSRTYGIVSRLVGIVYLIAFIPWLFEIIPLIGCNGLQPANELLKTAYSSEGMHAVVRFPSLFWIYPNDSTLTVLAYGGIFAGGLLVLNIFPLVAATVAWVCFTSLTVVGGDFLVIIIDLFLSEVGFLLIILHLALRFWGYVPAIVRFSFVFLNFRLWFCMGIMKFYNAYDLWKDGSFFYYFFPNQPMPTAVSWYAVQLPKSMFWIGEAWLFVGQLAVPFLVFGNKWMRWIAFANFFFFSLAIILVGNYGYFNVLSIVVAIAIFKDTDFATLQLRQRAELKPVKKAILYLLAGPPLLIQFFYTVAVFDPHPPGNQNHFNHVFLYKNWQQPPLKYISILAEPYVFARISNPYGVFKSMPAYRVELRFSGSADGVTWKPYRFKYVPSSNTQALKRFAPYYPRIDHLMFYETLDAGGYNFNLLNPYNTRENVWTCRFIEKLKSNDAGALSLLEDNPFPSAPPVYIRCDAHKLVFGKDGKNWESVGVKQVYNTQTDSNCRPLMQDINVVDIKL